MASQLITEDLLPMMREWLDYNLAAGCSHQDLRATLMESGYTEAEVDRFLAAEAAARAKRPAGSLFDAAPVGEGEAVERFWRRLDVLHSFNELSLGDRTVRVLAKNPRYGVFFLSGLLSDEECAELIAAAAPGMGPSRVLDESDGAWSQSETRSSRGGSLGRGSSDLVRRIESRIAKLTDLPVAHGENLNILQYALGAEYRPHFDYFDPDSVGGQKVLAKASQRLLSVIIYLSDVEAGGATQFPELALEFLPLKGAALVFPSIGRDGAVMPVSLHAGLPVTSGEKWIATKWIRLRPHPVKA